MCGIVGAVARSPVNQLLYDGMTVLQHRGQDAAGIATMDGHRLHLHKGNGLVKDVFDERAMALLSGRVGIGNIAACVQGADTRRHMMSHNGIVGDNIRKIQQFEAEFSADFVDKMF